MNRRESLQSVVVVGGGLVALSAAIGFARALPRATVTFVATAPDPAALADRLPAVTPQAAEAFEALGIDEAALVAAGAATHRIGERFTWGEAPFTIGESETMPTIAGAALHQLWLAHGDGPFDALVPAAALATAERFAPPVDDPRSLLSQVTYTLRLDADAATPAFLDALRAARVRVVAPESVRIDREGDRVTALTTSDGLSLTADLFVDASGPAALLAAQDAAWIDWSATLPVDRLLLGAAPPRPSPLDRYEATTSGWTARWPLAGRTLAAVAYAAATTSDARAARQMTSPGERIAIRPRRQVMPLTGNVLALGDAAAALGPLGWPGFTLALANLDLALALMPVRTPEPLLVAEYNRRATLRADRLHAYAAAFYGVGHRRGDIWHAQRARQHPAELATALAQFGQRGTLPPLEEEMVPQATWQQALIGLGVRPVRRDPLALSAPRAGAVAALAGLRQAVAALPAGLPAYPEYLAAAQRGRR
ncbi:tryptophan 7-halogenase [Sphingomonas melonis]|uniref:Tryptophan halogenase n=1 Tax=Sphingomonas melonis TaxID=152682 RepID=A0A7Y9FLS1_9SPHN|nr:tryptophan halogenase [Sphingomonas melonis]